MGRGRGGGGKGRDIDSYMLSEEMEAVKFLIPDTLNKHAVDILRHIVTSIGSAEFPNFYIALRTLLTIPVTVAILSIEHEVARDLNYTDVIDSFAAAKARKVVL